MGAAEENAKRNAAKFEKRGGEIKKNTERNASPPSDRTKEPTRRAVRAEEDENETRVRLN